MANAVTPNVKFVSGDIAPSIFGTLTDTNSGEPLVLTGAVVRFQMREAIDRRFAVNAVATVVDATAGEVRYDWQVGDLGAPGDYVSRWLVTFDDSTTEHTIPANTISIETP